MIGLICKCNYYILIDYSVNSGILTDYIITKIINFKIFYFFDLNKTSLNVHQCNKRIKK